MPTDIREIAARTGLSAPTVRHILGNQAHKYRPETRRKVLEAAAALHYRPNASAQAMRAGRFGAVALLLSTRPYHSYLPDVLLDGIHDALAEHDLHLTLARLPDARLADADFVPKILRQFLADGLLINYTHGFPPRLRQLVEDSATPTVWLNTKMEADCVYPDDLAAGRQAAEYLLALGHRRIAYVSLPAVFPSPHHSVGDRYEGYAQALTQAGGQPEVIAAPPGSEDVGREEILARLSARLSQPDRPTAAICFMPVAALALRRAAAALGLCVPQDLSLIAFDAQPADDVDLAIATGVLPEREMGRAAVDMLRRKIERPGEPLPPRVLPFTFEAGASCTPPP